MLVSIIIPSYKIDNYRNLIDAIDSLIAQSYQEIEVIVVVHTSKRLYDEVAAVYDSQSKVHLIFNEASLGAYAARNIGIKAAQGDILAFIDDDAVADREWVVNLVDTYQKFNALAVGGKILPMWLGDKPDHFPQELYWLVGVTHRGFAEDEVVEVRNAFGPNMSFKKEVFEKVGVFNENLGFAKQGTSYIQAGEAEFSLRMTSKFGAGVIYNPKAVVCHKIPVSKAGLKLLLKRSFYQGYSKATLQSLGLRPNSITTEKSYLKDLLLKYIPERIKGVLTGPGRVAHIKQLSVLISSIVAVGLGFVYGSIGRALTSKIEKRTRDDSKPSIS